MKFGIFHRPELMGVSTWIVEELEKAYSAIGGTWSVDHKDNGQHGDVRADSYRERGRTVANGVWTVMSFNAGNFTASGTQTWTVTSGDVRAYRYMFTGTTLWLSFNIQTSSVGGVPSSELRIALPSGYTISADGGAAGWADDNGTPTGTVLLATTGSAYVAILRTDNANWAAAANTTRVTGQIALEVTS